MTKIVPSIVINVVMKDFVLRGMISSIMLISFENRLTILPMGVVSKNDIGHRITFQSKELCKFLDARIEPNAKAYACTKTAKPWPRPKPPYTPK